MDLYKLALQVEIMMKTSRFYLVKSFFLSDVIKLQLAAETIPASFHSVKRHPGKTSYNEVKPGSFHCVRWCKTTIWG